MESQRDIKQRFVWLWTAGLPIVAILCLSRPANIAMLGCHSRSKVWTPLTAVLFSIQVSDFLTVCTGFQFENCNHIQFFDIFLNVFISFPSSSYPYLFWYITWFKTHYNMVQNTLKNKKTKLLFYNIMYLTPNCKYTLFFGTCFTFLRMFYFCNLHLATHNFFCYKTWFKTNLK